MRWKTTLVLLIATVGIGVYISRYELRQPSPEERERLAKRVLDIPADSVSQLTLELPQATLTLIRDGSVWRLSSSRGAQDSARSGVGALEPHGVRADPDLVNQLLLQFEPLTADRALSASQGKAPLDPVAFGLHPPQGTVTLTSKGSPTRVLIGGPTPVRHRRYLMVEGRPDIFVVSSELFDTANQPPETFRDPMLLRSSTWRAETLTASSPASAFTIVRLGNDWRLTQPLSDRVSRTEVGQLLHRLTGIRIKRFVNEAPQVEQLSQWGFDHAAAEVTLREEGAQARPVTLFFGKPLVEDNSLVYAKRIDEPSLYAVLASDVDALLPDPNRLREHTCLNFFTGETAKVELTTGGSGWTIERVNGQWRAAGSATTLDTQRVEAFFNTLADLQLSGFVEEHPQDLRRYGLDPADSTIAVWTLNVETPQRLLVGSAVEASTNRYGRIEGREPVVRLPETVTELLATTLNDLRSPEKSSPPTQFQATTPSSANSP